MKKEDLSSLTIAELKALAKKKKITLPASAKKTDIMKALGGKPAKKSAAPKKAAAKKKTAAKKKAAARPGRAAGKKTAAKKTAPKRTAPKKRPIAGRPAAKTAEQTPPLREWQMPGGWEAPHAGQELVTEAKFFTGMPDHRPAMPYDTLPHEYGRERIGLLARDPHMAFSYWELPQARLEKEKAWFGWDTRLCIRIYDVTGVQFNGTNATAYFDQEVYERVGSWYFDLGRPARAFCCDLGLMAPDGRFLTLLRSNTVVMPREGVSDVLDEEWMMVDEEFMKLYGMPGGAGRGGMGGMTSAEAQELLRQRRLLEITSPGTFSKQKQRKK
jgi:hypothetical protein